MKFKKIFTLIVLSLLTSMSLIASNPEALAAGLVSVLRNTSTDPKIKAAKQDLFDLVMPQLNDKARNTVRAAAIGATGLFNDLNAYNAAVAKLVPQTPAQFAQKFADTITQNAVPIAGNFKENTPVATLGNKAPSDADIKLMKTAVRNLADQIGV